MGHRVVPLLKRTGKEVLDDGVLGLAAQTAYYFFFSLFPIILFAAPLFGLFGEREDVFRTMMAELGAAVPPEAMRMLEAVLEDVVFSPNAPGLMSVGALLALWSGANVFTALIDALNRAYDLKEARPWWKKKLISVAAAVGAGVVILLASVLVVGGPQVGEWIGDSFNLGEAGRTVAALVQYALAFAFLVGLAFATFRFLPNLRQDWRHVLVAAVVTSALWVLVTLAFRAYVQNFGSYNKTYGTIGGIIVLLTWMYLTMLVVLVGGEFAAELHHGTGAIEARRGVTLGGRIGNGLGALASSDRIGRVAPLSARPPER